MSPVDKRGPSWCEVETDLPDGTKLGGRDDDVCKGSTGALRFGFSAVVGRDEFEVANMGFAGGWSVRDAMTNVGDDDDDDDDDAD